MEIAFKDEDNHETCSLFSVPNAFSIASICVYLFDAFFAGIEAAIFSLSPPTG